MVSTLESYSYSYSHATNRGYWRWTIRVDISGPSISYYVQNIVTPWCVLTEIVPIPGDVIQAMANSITLVQTQFKPIISVSPSSLVFTTTEGMGFGNEQTLFVTNTGVYGSLLNASITTSASYVVSQPSQVSGLGSSEQGVANISISAETLLAINSPYTQGITITDPQAVVPSVTIPVTINVLPKATITVTPLSLSFTVSKPLSGPFPPIPSASFTITNSGPVSSILDYKVQKLIGGSSWLVSYAPPIGTLTGGSSQLITVVAQPEDCYLPGTYTETLRVFGYSTNSYVDVVVTLTVT